LSCVWGVELFEEYNFFDQKNFKGSKKIWI
jgi:hypothetical protein